MNRELSCIEFIWDEVSPSGAGVFRRDTVGFLPNPERLYGLYATNLRCFFTAKSRAAAPWNWVARVLDPQGRMLLEQSFTAQAGSTMRGAARLDVSTLPAGGEDREGKARAAGRTGAVVP